MSDLELGLEGKASLSVSEADTARAVGSGAVVVLGTPVMIALMEQASVAATAPRLPPDQVTVGTQVAVRHLAPTPVGMGVVARATLTEIDGRVLTFEVEAWDDKERIGVGTVQRVIVDRERFQGRADEKGMVEAR